MFELDLPRVRRTRAGAAVAALFLSAGLAAQAQQAEAPAAGVDANAAATADLPIIPVVSLTPEPKEPVQKAAVELGGVKVLGSHIKRTDTATAQPVVQISRKDLERTGITTIGDILQTLPSAGAAFNTTLNNGGTGATEIDLRNLGSNRVLVLVDGHRWVSGLRSLSTSSVDLNTIPLAIIDRVEVLQDGASAAYGSDAITGVVNIITRKRFPGLQFSTQSGVFTQGDGLQQLHSLTGGHNFGSLFGGQTSLIGSFSFQDQKPVLAADRAISRLPLANTGLTRGSSFVPEGRSLFIPNQQNSALLNAANPGACAGLAGSVAQGAIDGQNPPVPVTIPGQLDQLPVGVNLCDIIHITGQPATSTNNFRPFTSPDDLYNYALTNYLSTPLRTYNTFAGVNHEFNDNVSFSLQFLSSVRQSSQQLAPHPLAIGNLAPVIGGFIPGQTISYNQATYISRNNPYNPFGQDIGRIDPNDPSNADPCVAPIPGAPCGPAAGLVGQGAVLRRVVEGGPRVQLQDVPTTFVRGGFNGNFDLLRLPFDWEAGYSFGQSRQKQLLTNLFRQDRVQQALGDNCTGDCVPLNFLGGPGTLTKEMLAYVQYNDYNSTVQKQYDAYVNVSTSIPGLIWGSPLGIAFGGERHTSHYTFLPSLEAINNTTSGLTSLPTDGGIASKEGFLELSLPLVPAGVNLPLLNKLELSLAGRYSDYGAYGHSPDGKVGLAWKPYRDLLLRSTFSTSFRAPDVGNLFLGNAGSYPGLVDPCDPANGRRPAGSNADANCTADGVSASQLTAQILSPFVGNPNLKSESSHSFSAGIVFSPAQIEGLDLSVDYFKIGLNDFITAPGGQYALDRCYSSPSNQRSFCGNVTRAADGTLLQVLNQFTNFPKISTSGVDFEFNYALPTKAFPLLASLGKFKLVSTATFVSSYNQFIAGADGTLQKFGLVGKGNFENGVTLPRWKINPSLQWSNGPFQGSISSRIIGEQVEPCDDGRTPTLVSLGLCSDPNHKNPDGSDGPLNTIKMKARTDLQLGYNLKRYQTAFTLGAQNIFNVDPPISYSAFANSFDGGTYWVPGVMPYFSLKKDFK